MTARISGSAGRYFTAARFRAPAHYQLISFDDLPPAQQALLSDLRKDPQFYGILSPHGRAGLGVKSVEKTTARLYEALEGAAPLPAFVPELLGEDFVEAVARLVLDGVLEIEVNGVFVSGVDAHALIFEGVSTHAGEGAIARLSLDALRYAQSLDVTDPAVLSWRTYRYNTLPASPRWRRRLPTAEAVAAFVEIDVHGGSAYFAESIAEGESRDGWLIWRGRADAARSDSEIAYKLYVSPKVESVPEALRAVLELFAGGGASTCKIGRNLFGLLRPDKLVVYFKTFDDLEAAAGRLQRELGGMPAHGVPFTAEIAGDGLLSWGIDPPRDQHLLGWRGSESWRLWVTNRLATAILAAKGSGSHSVEPWQFALDRLRLEGLDPESWTPAGHSLA
jgi:hypothetical protein